MNDTREIFSQVRSGIPLTSLVLMLGFFGMVMRPGGYQPKPQQQLPQRNPMTLIASPNDPQMVEAIRIAQATARYHAGGNAWTKDKTEGPTATFATPGGSITLSRSEIADANTVYPQLLARALHPREYGAMRRSADAGFDSEFSDRSQWGN